MIPPRVSILTYVAFAALLPPCPAATPSAPPPIPATPAQEKAHPPSVPLWPNGAPGALGDEAKDKPTLIIYLPEKATGVGIVICPGGGYGGLAMDHEGHQIGRWLNENGIAGFICDYRHRRKGYGHPAPLQDAQRAIRTVRAAAFELSRFVEDVYDEE